MTTVTYHDACTMRYGRHRAFIAHTLGFFTVPRMQAIEAIMAKIPEAVLTEMIAEDVPLDSTVDVSFDVAWEGDTPRLTVVNWEVVP